jgi:hypothetical protein
VPRTGLIWLVRRVTAVAEPAAVSRQPPVQPVCPALWYFCPAWHVGEGASAYLGNVIRVVFCNSLDGRRPANLQTALVTW